MAGMCRLTSAKKCQMQSGAAHHRTEGQCGMKGTPPGTTEKGLALSFTATPQPISLPGTPSQVQGFAFVPTELIRFLQEHPSSLHPW